MKLKNPELQTTPQNLIQHIQNQCSSLLQNHHVQTIIHQTKHTLETTISNFTSASFNQSKKKPLWLETTISNFTSASFNQSKKKPLWANLSFNHTQSTNDHPIHRFDLALATEAIEERLAGVPVYALSNSNEEFVLISGVKTGKSLGLFCFNKKDADSLLERMRSMDPGMRRGSKVVAVALNKVFQLKINGVAFRFIPDSSQIMNAIKVKQNAGLSSSDFSGVPVFQSQSLILKSDNKRYRPVFFRKEDLENSLKVASLEQRKLNPAFRQGDIQVSVLEEIITGMKGSSTSKWDDVVFIPPGFDVSADLAQQEKLTASG